MTAKSKHGGRRHGLARRGPAPRVTLTLSPADQRSLMLRAEAEGCSQAEVVRRLVRDAPDPSPPTPATPPPPPTTTIVVEVNEQEAARLLRMARRLGPAITPADVARTALVTHMTMAMSQSPFLMTFGRVLEDLVAMSVHPIVVGRWAVAAHGYLTPIEGGFELAVRQDEVPKLREYLAFKGSPDPHRPLPITVGHLPWSITFATSFGEVAASELPVEWHGWGGTNLEVLALDGLLQQRWSQEVEEDYVSDALRELKEGRHKLDDGERGVIAWDAAARMTCGLHPADPGMGSLRFVEFREVS